jgi:LPXTG-motif cell wall-anchored protein
LHKALFLNLLAIILLGTALLGVAGAARRKKKNQA